MRKKFLINFSLIIVIAVSIFTHFYRIGELYNFHNDEGRDALVAAKILTTHRPVLLGPQTSVGNMYLGPIYYYLMAVALFFSHFDPVGPAVMVALSAVLTTYIIYYIGRQKMNSASALFAALIFALSPLMVHYTRSSWNPNLVPFIASLMLLLVTQLENEPAHRGWLMLGYGLLSGVMFQLHYVALAYVGLLSLYLLIKRHINYRSLGIIFVGFMISSSPFWAFEARHDWVNSQAFLTYLTKSPNQHSSLIKYIARVEQNSVNAVADTLASRPLTYNTTPLWYMGLLASLILVVTMSAGFGRLMVLLLAGSVLTTSLLSETIYPHYTSYLFPIISLVGGSLFNLKGKLKLLGVILLISFLYISLPALSLNLTLDSSHQVEKAKAVAEYIQKDADSAAYNVVAGPTNARETTYLYFLDQSSHPPSATKEPLLYMICEDVPCTQADANRSDIFARGPSHPSLEDQLSHPYTPVSLEPKIVQDVTHILYGTWVARIKVTE